MSSVNNSLRDARWHQAEANKNGFPRIAAGLIETQQYQMLCNAGLFNASSDVFPVVANALDSVFGQIVIPGHAVMLQEREQTLAISEEALL